MLYGEDLTNGAAFKSGVFREAHKGGSRLPVYILRPLTI